MGSNPTKAADNIYCKCRKEAAIYNDKLNSREGASDMLGMSVSSLADYELGNTKVVPVDKVVLMADLYNAPELKNYYCSHECPIGINTVHKLEQAEFDRTMLRLLAALHNGDDIKEKLINIAADGKITDNEKPTLQSILQDLNAIILRSQELIMWVEKNIKDE